MCVTPTTLGDGWADMGKYSVPEESPDIFTDDVPYGSLSPSETLHQSSLMMSLTLFFTP